MGTAEKTESLSGTWGVAGDLAEHNTVGKGKKQSTLVIRPVIFEESGLVKNRNVFSVFNCRNKDGMWMGKVIVLAGGGEWCGAVEAVLSSVEAVLSSSRSARKLQDKVQDKLFS